MRIHKTTMVLAALLLCLCGCDTSDLETRLDGAEERLAALEKTVSQVNSDATALGTIVKGDNLITGFTETESGYTLEFSDGTILTVTDGINSASVVPMIGIDKDGKWIASIDSGTTWTPIKGADNAMNGNGITPQIRIDEDGYWCISTDGTAYTRITGSDGKPLSAVNGNETAGNYSFFSDVQCDSDKSEIRFTLIDGRTVTVPYIDSFFLKVKGFSNPEKIRLDETRFYETESSDVSSVIISAPEGWAVKLTDAELSVKAAATAASGEYEVALTAVSSKGYIKIVNLLFSYEAVSYNQSGCKLWNDFIAGNSSNLLLDYSYAGYMHGEVAPPDGFSLGYKVFNVCDYGAVPNDGKSDRDAFLAAYQAAIGPGAVQNPAANAVIYFPEGEYILHTSADNDNGASVCMFLRAGNFVVKGAGRDKTILVMQDENLPASSALYSSPVMMDFKHYSGLTELTSVTSDASKGSFSVDVASTSGISEGDWVCLSIADNSADFIAEELAPYSVEPGMTDLLEQGVKVFDYHQIKSIKGSKVTFVEPIMRAVSAARPWKIYKYPHYENVGIEDLSFRGNAKADFVHHGTWKDDGAYKPVSMTRITNGWFRRVGFESVSEALTITNSANVSAYDITITGNRGHSSVRSQVSSRIFIGAVKDSSDGNITGTTTFAKGTGQYHATGVSKPSIGTVLWRNSWGIDSNFESHATQPRATLIDCCTGGWLQYRQGGDENQVPNHLNDLTIWNFNSTTACSGTWKWYDVSGKWWKFLPPVIAGFHGMACTFDPGQVKAEESHGTPVDPESLYEAQLRARLGYVPSWLNSLK